MKFFAKLVAVCAATASPAVASDVVLYCVVEQAVGFKQVENAWQPIYGDGRDGKRYTVKFREDFSEVIGVEGTETPYLCISGFPNKAPDVVTCTNSKVATMTFNYSKENGNFIFSMVSPGGWLGVDTQRQDMKESMTDHLLIGKCQGF
jgi:hypothetical protein